MMALSWLRRIVYFPKEPSDQIAFFFLIFSTHVICLFELFIILPYIDGELTIVFWCHVFVGLTLYANIYVSFYKLIAVDTTVKADGLQLPAVQKSGWFYCAACGLNTPPRSVHCFNCELCIVRRDHHCLFSGRCVGHMNQRYFVSFLVNLTIAAMYCNYLNMDYALEVLGGLSFRALLTVILPLFAWSVGLAGGETFVVSLISSVCLVGLVLLALLFVYHVRNILHGQTGKELNTGVRDYDCGWKSNVQVVLGSKWYLAWICPFVDSPNGNGLDFPKRYQYENIKDL